MQTSKQRVVRLFAGLAAMAAVLALVLMMGAFGSPHQASAGVCPGGRHGVHTPWRWR